MAARRGEVISVVDVVLDKFVYTFPCMGPATNIGGIQVDASRGWDIDSGFDKRAAGFSRSSISAVVLLPILAAIIAPRTRSWMPRPLFLALTCGAVALTTQRRIGRGGGGQPHSVHAGAEGLQLGTANSPRQSGW